MTGPLRLQPAGEGSRYIISFMMPARYNSPFSLWVLCRNKVLIEIEAAD
jgi:hypothetical protein